jgi:cytochrome b6-f complex iron-sulfur subunit
MTVQPDADRGAGSAAEMSRREFLNYAWLASIGIFVIQSGVATFQFAMPRLGPGEFGGVVDLGGYDALPAAGAPPEPFNKAKFWWVQTDQGALALYKVCTHLGCIFDWKTADGKFICPCHGSQFEREGKYIAGPAPRGLDRFVIRAYDAAGKLVAETDPSGGPVKIPGGTTIKVDTGARINGAPKNG